MSLKEITRNYSDILGGITNKHAKLQSETFSKKSLQKVKKKKGICGREIIPSYNSERLPWLLKTRLCLHRSVRPDFLVNKICPFLQALF